MPRTVGVERSRERAGELCYRFEVSGSVAARGERIKPTHRQKLLRTQAPPSPAALTSWAIRLDELVVVFLHNEDGGLAAVAVIV